MRTELALAPPRVLAMLSPPLDRAANPIRRRAPRYGSSSDDEGRVEGNVFALPIMTAKRDPRSPTATMNRPDKEVREWQGRFASPAHALRSWSLS